MSLKWTGSNSESGILRRSEFKEKKEELFVFGYSCKLFRDDDKAQHIDQGKHLIPWMGDETLKIDRYDARGALHDLSRLEAPPGGYDWRVELTRGEQDVELLCDEERYRALHTDEDEEEMYKEEELKRLHAAGYGQVSFNYDTPAEPSPAQPAEVDEPFEPTTEFKALLPADVVLPDGVKQNAIIEKTALFIEKKGPQMEILIKAKQQDNPQFQFLNKDAPLHTYYTALIGLVKSGKWPKKKVEPVVEEEKPPESEEYLHPSLSTIIESAPSIPSIHYKPSADCDYTLLISKMRGEPILDESYPPVLAPGEVAPPGTEPLPPRANAEISRAPVMYNQQADSTAQAQAQLAHYQQYAAYYQQYMAQQALPTTKLPPRSLPVPQSLPQTKVVEKEGPVKSTGLSLMKNYNTDSDSDSDSEDSSSTASKGKPAIPTPPEDVKVVIDKMAAYVARNGDDFENIVRAKNDPRFMFLEPENEYHAFYRKLMQEKRGGDVNGKGKEAKATAPTVCFSIKKHKEPEPILPKPALPYESSSDEESEDKPTKQAEEPPPQTNIPPVVTVNNSIPPVVVYKMEANQANSLPIVKAIEAKPAVSIPNQTINKPPVEYKEPPKETTPIPQVIEQSNKVPEIKKYRSLTPTKEDKYKEEEYRKEKKRHKEKKKERERDRKIEKESRKSERRSVEREREREKRDRVVEREKRERHEKRKYNKEELDSEIITLEESEEFIDLTGDMPEPKDESEADRQRKLERRQKAAEFLRRAGVEPGTLPAGSLASAMVDTLETIRRKKEEEEEKRRRREKKRQKERRAYDDEYEKYHRKSKRRRQSDSESDYDGSKRKKRKKDKKSSKSKKKRAHSESPLDYTEDSQVPIDISSTLKELRSNTPTKDLINDLEDTQHSYITRRDTSSDSEEDVVKRDRMSEEKSEKRKTKSKPREYSEGEWSSDSDEDSESTGGKYE